MTKEELKQKAEEYREKGKREGYYLVSQEMEQGELDYIIDESFKDGAEFGYKRGQSDQLVHKQYQLNQLRKANEWHYVSKGEYPDNDNDILCQIDFETFEVGYFNEMYNNFFTIDGKEIEVKAWKEIVLPKESE
jgi:hypothetical protein